jgi:hypothetical protein
MKKLVLVLAASLCVFGCKKDGEDNTASDIEETAQQIGDIMASMDEQGADDGTIAATNKLHLQKTFARYNQDPPAPVVSNVMNLMIAPAEAAACYSFGVGSGWGLCSGRTLVRSFNNCTIGTTAVLSGDVTLTWAGNGSACDWAGAPVAGDSIKRVPNFTLTGRRGATLTVTAKKTDGVTVSDGQLLKFVSGSAPNMVFHFTNDGIRRKFTTASNTTLFDQTTTVASGTPIVVTGNSRSNRIMNGGFLTVTDTLNSVVCNFTPSNVTWNSATCNCAVQGSWSGICDNGSNPSLTITGCGTATYTDGISTTNVTFDRCSN